MAMGTGGLVRRPCGIYYGVYPAARIVPALLTDWELSIETPAKRVGFVVGSNSWKRGKWRLLYIVGLARSATPGIGNGKLHCLSLDRRYLRGERGSMAAGLSHLGRRNMRDTRPRVDTTGNIKSYVPLSIRDTGTPGATTSTNLDFLDLFFP